MLDDVNVLYKIASLYYENGNTQDEIARKVNMSRPMVSRALEKARNIGLVRISVFPPKKFTDLAETISKTLDIHEVIIAPASSSTGNDRFDRLNDISDTAAGYLEKTITGGMTVGFGCGMTVYQTVKKLRHVTPVGDERPVFVPLTGSLGSKQAEFQVSIIVNHAATMLNAKAYYYNVPTMVVKEEETAVIRDTHKEVYNIWKNLDMAVIGIGSFANISSYPMDSFSEEEHRYLASNGAKGDILGRFFNDYGVLAPGKMQNVYAGIPREDMDNVGNIVCVCGGTEKVDPIIAAARQKCFDTLITDYRTINEISEKLQEEKR